MMIEPALMPAPAGLKVTLILQLALGAKGAVVEQVVPEARAKLPLTLMLERVIGTVPMLFRVTLETALVVPSTPGLKVRLPGVMGRKVPVPFSTTDCGLPVASSAMVSDPAIRPAALGVKVMGMTHCAPVANAEPTRDRQGVPLLGATIANCDNVVAMAEMLTGMGPVLATVTV